MMQNLREKKLIQLLNLSLILQIAFYLFFILNVVVRDIFWNGLIGAHEFPYEFLPFASLAVYFVIIVINIFLIVNLKRQSIENNNHKSQNIYLFSAIWGGILIVLIIPFAQYFQGLIFNKYIANIMGDYVNANLNNIFNYYPVGHIIDRLIGILTTTNYFLSVLILAGLLLLLVCSSILYGINIGSNFAGDGQLETNL
jgi:hypothetical protein